MPGDYQSFMYYLESITAPADLINYQKQIHQLKNDPEAMKEELSNKLMELWDDNADQKPRTGNPRVQRENFKKFINKEILQEDNKGYINYLENKNNPVIKEFQQPIFEEELKHDPKIKVSSRLIKKLQVLNPPSNRKKLIKELITKNNSLDEQKLKYKSEYELLKLWAGTKKKVINEKTREQTFERLNRSLERAYSSGNHANVKSIYEEVARIKAQPRNIRGLDTIQINSLMDKAWGFLKSYGEEHSPNSLKSKNELIDSLKTKGINAEGKNYSEITSLAKQQGIGLFRRDLNKDELISKLLNKSPVKFTYKELEDKNEIELSKMWNRIKFQKPKQKKVLYELEDLPSDKNSLKELFERKGKKPPYNKINTYKKELSFKYPFLTDEELTNKATKLLASETMDKPVLDKEVERRYSYWKYNNPNKKIDLFDMMELSKMNKKLFEGTLKNDIDNGTIPYDQWKSYQMQLKDQVQKQIQMIDVKNKVNKISVVENKPTIIKKYAL